MTNPKLTTEIASLRADPDPIHHQRNRMLASMLECLNDEGLEAFANHTNDLIACILITFRHAGFSIPQVREIIDYRLDTYEKLLTRLRDAASP